MGGHDNHSPAAAAPPGEVRCHCAAAPVRARAALAPPQRFSLWRTFSQTQTLPLLPSLPALAQPTPFVSDPTRASTTRCKRRWNDLVLLRLDAMAPKTYTGASRGSAPRPRARARACARPRAALRLLPAAPHPLSRSHPSLLSPPFSCRALPPPPLPAPPLPRPAGPTPRFPQQTDLLKLVRERYLLFAQCVESKPGQEPKHPYLYPQAAVAAPAHH